MTEVKVEELDNELYVKTLIGTVLKNCGIAYKGMSVRWKNEEGSIVMIYVDIDNYVDCHQQMAYNDMPDETYDKFYTKVGLMVEDNDLVSKGYDITPMLLN